MLDKAQSVLSLVIKARDEASKVLGQVNDKMKEGQEKAGKLGGKFKAVGGAMSDVGSKASAFLSLPIIGFMGFAANRAVDLGEAQNAANVIFEEGADKLLKYSETASKTAGLSERAFLQASVPIGAALRNQGMDAQFAADKTVAITERAADMASVFNTDVSTALEAIQAGLRGEADPLERFGVGLSAAAIESYAMANGIATAGEEMTEQQKMLARLGLLFEQTDKLQGDFVNTSDQAANKSRVAKAEFENQAATLGEKLEPILNKVLDVALKLIDGFAGLPEPVQNALLIFAGVTAILGPVLLVLGWLISFIGTIITLWPVISAGAAAAGTAIGAIAAPVLIAIGVIAAIIAIGIALWKNWDHIKYWAGVLWEVLKWTFGQIKDWVINKFNELKDGALGAWDRFKNGISKGVDWVKSKLDEFKKKATDLKDGVVGAFDGLKTGAGNALKGLVNSLTGNLNGGIRQANGLIERVRDIPGAGWIPLIPELPTFANGGIVPGTSKRGDKMLIRANSGEMILNDNQQGKLWKMINQGVGGVGGAVVNISKIVLGGRATEGDAKELVRMIKRELIKEGFQTA